MKSSEESYRMPAEWERHAATLMHWPSNGETWPGERLDRVERVYGRILSVLTRHERVHLLAADESVRERAERVLEGFEVDRGRLDWHVRPLNDVWVRDCGPIFVRRVPAEGERRGDAERRGGSGAPGEPVAETADGPGGSGRDAAGSDWVITDWEYNAWGGKYLPYGDDNAIPFWFANRFDLPRIGTGMVLEGGSIEVDGKGTLLTTESVLLNPNRNPGLDRGRIGEQLRRYLGAEQVIWLGRGLAGDDTDGHVDDLARFLNPSTILAVTAPEGDVNHTALAENLEILRSVTRPDGAPFTIETLPLPETRIEGTTVDGSGHVPASYANFYVANGVVLVPLYDARHDAGALDLFRRYFPEREVAGIPCTDLVWGQGSIHCITQQLYGLPT